MDVFEHIQKLEEERFINNLTLSINETGVVILGIPSLESQKYAGTASRIAHVNWKSGIEFKKLMESFFPNCFLFSMNDEVLHTGFLPMSHFFICVSMQPEIK